MITYGRASGNGYNHFQPTMMTSSNSFLNQYQQPLAIPQPLYYQQQLMPREILQQQHVAYNSLPMQQQFFGNSFSNYGVLSTTSMPTCLYQQPIITQNWSQQNQGYYLQPQALQPVQYYPQASQPIQQPQYYPQASQPIQQPQYYPQASQPIQPAQYFYPQLQPMNPPVQQSNMLKIESIQLNQDGSRNYINFTQEEIEEKFKQKNLQGLQRDYVVQYSLMPTPSGIEVLDFHFTARDAHRRYETIGGEGSPANLQSPQQANLFGMQGVSDVGTPSSVYSPAQQEKQQQLTPSFDSRQRIGGQDYPKIDQVPQPSPSAPVERAFEGEIQPRVLF